MVGSPTVTSELAKQPFAGFEPAADGRDDITEPFRRGWRTTGTTDGASSRPADGGDE